MFAQGSCLQYILSGNGIETSLPATPIQNPNIPDESIEKVVASFTLKNSFDSRTLHQEFNVLQFGCGHGFDETEFKFTTVMERKHFGDIFSQRKWCWNRSREQCVRDFVRQMMLTVLSKYQKYRERNELTDSPEWKFRFLFGDEQVSQIGYLMLLGENIAYASNTVREYMILEPIETDLEIAMDCIEDLENGAGSVRNDHRPRHNPDTVVAEIEDDDSESDVESNSESEDDSESDVESNSESEDDNSESDYNDNLSVMSEDETDSVYEPLPEGDDDEYQNNGGSIRVAVPATIEDDDDEFGDPEGFGDDSDYGLNDDGETPQTRQEDDDLGAE